jgi:hypothetical protein
MIFDIVVGLDTYRSERKERGNGPADEGKRNLQSFDDHGILSNARTDDTDSELKDVWKEVGNDLRNPQAQPDWNN